MQQQVLLDQERAARHNTVLGDEVEKVQEYFAFGNSVAGQESGTLILDYSTEGMCFEIRESGEQSILCRNLCSLFVFAVTGKSMVYETTPKDM